MCSESYGSICCLIEKQGFLLQESSLAVQQFVASRPCVLILAPSSLQQQQQLLDDKVDEDVQVGTWQPSEGWGCTHRPHELQTWLCLLGVCLCVYQSDLYYWLYSGCSLRWRRKDFASRPAEQSRRRTMYISWAGWRFLANQARHRRLCLQCREKSCMGSWCYLWGFSKPTGLFRWQETGPSTFQDKWGTYSNKERATQMKFTPGGLSNRVLQGGIIRLWSPEGQAVKQVGSQVRMFTVIRINEKSYRCLEIVCTSQTPYSEKF